MSWIEAIRAAKQQKLSRQAVANSRLAQDYPGLALALGQGEPDEEGEGTPMPDWLVDLPDDLDICIAERNFEQAVRLLQKGRVYTPVAQPNFFSFLQNVAIKAKTSALRASLCRTGTNNKFDPLSEFFSSRLLAHAGRRYAGNIQFSP